MHTNITYREEENYIDNRIQINKQSNDKPKTTNVKHCDNRMCYLQVEGTSEYFLFGYVA